MPRKASRSSPERRRTRRSGKVGLIGFLLGSKLNLLLLLVPVSLAVGFLGLPEVWAFVTAGLAIVPLAGLIGEGTEEVANRAGPGIGGLVTATFGNAAELIIALFALGAGLQAVVKASISGSLIGNLLLVLGMSMLVGGWGRDVQTFNKSAAGARVTMLFLAVIALVMPAVFDLAVYGSFLYREPLLEYLSLLVALVLAASYVAGLVFSLRTHRELVTSMPSEHRPPRLSILNTVLLLLLATAVLAVESEILVGAISAVTELLGISQFFVGIIVVALVGNVAEYFVAVRMAKRNRMDLSVAISTGASTQIALFVAPVLVFTSFIIGEPMALIFNPFELAAIVLAVLIVAVVSLDGESNWFEGFQLVAVYLILAIVFFFVPGA